MCDLVAGALVGWVKNSVLSYSDCMNIMTGGSQIREQIAKNNLHGSFDACSTAATSQQHVAATWEEVAMKVEIARAQHPQLIYEFKRLKHLEGAPGFDQIYHCDAEADFNIVVMELLGPSGEDQFNLCSRQLTIRIIFMIADQVLDRVEYLDNSKFINCSPEAECM
ncbi:hypothetical protein Efla_003094 [Eimeria flavescens]